MEYDFSKPRLHGDELLFKLTISIPTTLFGIFEEILEKIKGLAEIYGTKETTQAVEMTDEAEDTEEDTEEDKEDEEAEEAT